MILSVIVANHEKMLEALSWAYLSHITQAMFHSIGPYTLNIFMFLKSVVNYII